MKRVLEGSVGRCEVTAVVLDTQPVRSVRTRSGENVDCCVAFVGDPSLQYVQLSFWRTLAFNAAARIAVGDVIHATSLRRSEFQGSVSLNSTAQTAVKLLVRNGDSGTLDSQDDSARSLLQWAKRTFPAITRQLQTYSAWQCSSFQDLSHAAFISIAATMVSSEILADDHGNHATLVISDPVRHRTIMHEVIPRIGVRFHWRNLVCERRYDEWRLHATPHTTAETVSNENIRCCSDATHGSDTAKDSVLTPLDGECQSSHRQWEGEHTGNRCVMSVVEAHEVLSVGGCCSVELVDIRCSELACFVEGVDPAVLAAAADPMKCAQSLCTTDDTGKWSYKRGTLVLYDGPARTAGVAVHVPSDVMEHVMCNVSASLVAEDLTAPPHSRFGWAHAAAAVFRSLQGAQRPPLDIRVRAAAVELGLGGSALELVGVGVDRQFIVEP